MWKFEGPAPNCVVAKQRTNKNTDLINIEWVFNLVQNSIYQKWLEYLKNNIFHTFSNKAVWIGTKKEYLSCLPDLGWEIKLVHPFYSFHWLQGHKKYIFSILNHDSTRNSWHAIEFFSFFVIFDRKIAAILNFERFFKMFVKKAQLDHRENIVPKIEGPPSNVLVATGDHRQYSIVFTIND